MNRMIFPALVLTLIFVLSALAPVQTSNVSDAFAHALPPRPTPDIKDPPPPIPQEAPYLPALSITINASPTEVSRGDKIWITATVINPEKTIAKAVKIKINVPAGLDIGDIQTPFGTVVYQPGSEYIQIFVQPYPPNTTLTIRISAAVNPQAVPQQKSYLAARLEYGDERNNKQLFSNWVWLAIKD